MCTTYVASAYCMHLVVSELKRGEVEGWREGSINGWGLALMMTDAPMTASQPTKTIWDMNYLYITFTCRRLHSL